MTIRPIRRGDAGALLDMWNATARFDPLTPALLDEKIRGDVDFDPSMALVCEENGLLTGFMMAVSRQTDEGPRGFIKLAAVAADRRRRGVGGGLLAAVEDTLRDRGARTVRIGESAPNYLTPGVDCRYSAAPHFFRKHGYERLGEACNMTLDLETRDLGTESQERQLAQRGVEIRRASGSDLEPVETLVQTHWPSWRREVLNSLKNSPVSLHLAVKDNSTVAFSAFDTNNLGTGWFGPMGTAPEARRQGIGQVLLFRCLADIAAQGHRYAIIPWVGPVEFYRLCAGAAVSRIFNRYEKVLKA